MTKTLIRFSLLYAALAYGGTALNAFTFLFFDFVIPQIGSALFFVIVYFTGFYYGRIFKSEPTNAFAWKFAVLAVFTSIIISSPLLYYEYADGLNDLFSQLSVIKTVGSILWITIFVCIYIALVKFLFVFSVSHFRKKLAAKAMNRISPEVSLSMEIHRGIQIKQAIKIFITMAAALYIGVVIFVANTPSVLGSIGLTPFIDWVVYEWQGDLYGELLSVADFGIPLLIFQIMIVTYLFYALYLLAFTALAFKYKKQYLTYLKNEEFKTFVSLFDYKFFKYVTYFFGLIYAYFFVTFPKQMTNDYEVITLDLSGIAVYVFLALFLFPLLIFWINKGVKWLVTS